MRAADADEGFAGKGLEAPGQKKGRQELRRGGNGDAQNGDAAGRMLGREGADEIGARHRRPLDGRRRLAQPVIFLDADRSPAA